MWPFADTAEPRPRVEPTLDTGRVRNAGFYASNDPAVLTEVFGIQPTVTGRPVTDASSMRVAAVYACVKLIAGAVASLPLDVYRREPEGQRKRVNEADDLWWALNEQPHARWTAANFWKWMLKAELLRGDGFAEIIRGRGGLPTGMRPFGPIVTVELRDDRLAYFFTDDTGKARGLDQDDVIHIPGFGFDGKRGMSAIQWGARNGIGIALATEEFSGRFFGDGAMAKHAIMAPGRMNPPQIDALREQWAQKYSGLDNAYKPMVLTQGLDVKELSLSAADSQLLEARKFQVIDIARAFGVPPVLIAESEKTSSWGSGVEQIVLAFVKFTLADRLITIEQELNRKLFRTAGRFVKFNADELMRGDSQSRAKFLRELVGGSQGPGIITVNEARDSEGLSPRPGGDVLYDPKNMAAAAAPKPEPAP